MVGRSTSISPHRRPSASEHLSAENARLELELVRVNDTLSRSKDELTQARSEITRAGEAFDREVALRLRDEAERTMGKVEELWRVSSENEALKAENERLAADGKRDAVHVELLCEGMRAMEAVSASQAEQLAAARAEAAAAREAAAKLEATLATFNRHTSGLCQKCGGLYHNHNRLETAAYRSRSPRFGKGVEHAACGTKMGGNAPLSAEKALPGPGSHDAQRDRTGALGTMATRSSAEPYVSSPRSSSVSALAIS